MQKYVFGRYFMNSGELYFKNYRLKAGIYAIQATINCCIPACNNIFITKQLLYISDHMHMKFIHSCKISSFFLDFLKLGRLFSWFNR